MPIPRNEPKVATNIQLTVVQDAALTELAHQSRVSRSEYVRRLLQADMDVNLPTLPGLRNLEDVR